jgi:carbon starvation protein
MNSLVLAAIMLVGYLVAYHTYGKFLARRIFKLNPEAVCPSVAQRDGHDFVPTKKEILFGHHFTSIAGLGPIVGPAVAIIWGWVPAVIWVFFGSIFFGAVHDFGAMVVSLRAQGRSIGGVAADLINPRVRTLFLLIIFFELWILIAVYALIMAILFTTYPIAVIPVWFELVIAFLLGRWIYKQGHEVFWPSIVAVVIMYITVIIGAYVPVDLGRIFNMSAQATLVTWIILVMGLNAWLASALPVTTLLQPRDYINSHQLFVALALLVMGVVVAHPTIVAPAANFEAPGAPPVWPFIFVVIACGAISGFHSLVSSGTSSKQCDAELHSLPIGYGGMLLEGTLSVLVIAAVAAGIGMGLAGEGGEILTGDAAFNHHYSSWGAAAGLGSKLGAFVQGSANMMVACGIPFKVAVAVMTVFIVSFAGTTVDSATRIQRYVVIELGNAWQLEPLTGRQLATGFAVVTAAILAFYDGTGKGALKLWPLFGTVNQLLAGLALLVVTIYLARKKVAVAYTMIPMVLMILMTGWAMVINLGRYSTDDNWLLFFIGLIVFLLEVWMVIESVNVLRKVYGTEEKSLPGTVT